jgi:hypothetical protein
MTNRESASAGSPEAADERSVARKYGIRELFYPDREQVKVLTGYLAEAVGARRSGPVPKTAVLVMLEFLQQTVNRQHITKSPAMSPQEFDLLQTPYYLVTRVLGKIARERQDGAVARGQLYQASYASINAFIELLRNVLDPGCHWLRMKALPDGIIETMEALRVFAAALPEQRRKGRAL